MLLRLQNFRDVTPCELVSMSNISEEANIENQEILFIILCCIFRLQAALTAEYCKQFLLNLILLGLTLYRTYLKPYCTVRKTAFFQRPFKCIGEQERFRAFRPALDI
jgi:hypothetical protein